MAKTTTPETPVLEIKTEEEAMPTEKIVEPLNQDGDVEFYPQEEDNDFPVGQESPYGVWSAETAEEKPLKVLLYGPPGAGKTRYAATFPKPLFLDLEGGLRSTIGVGSVLRYPSDPRESITTYGEMQAFYKLVSNETNPPFETIVIDSLNELQELATQRVLAKFKQQNRQMDDQLTWQDYGKIGRDVINAVRGFLSLPYHIVFTAASTIPEYEGQQVHPDFTGKMVWKAIHKLLEQIGYCHVRKNKDGTLEHVVSYHLSPLYQAKSRLEINQPYLLNDYAALAPYIHIKK
jgi:hypothetical protein